MGAHSRLRVVVATIALVFAMAGCGRVPPSGSASEPRTTSPSASVSTPTISSPSPLAGGFLGPPAYTRHLLSAADRAAIGLAVGPDGSIWGYLKGGFIARLDTAGSVATFELPNDTGTGDQITIGPDGAVWFPDPFKNTIGRLTAAGQVTEFPLPTKAAIPAGIAPGPDGALWFAEEGANKIGRVTTGGVITEFALPTSYGAGAQYFFESPHSIVQGSDGAMWFTEDGLSPASSRVGRITTSGTVTEFDLPTKNASPYNIVAGTDGALWFTERRADRIGRITTQGAVTEFRIGGPGYPESIVQEPDHTVWFTDVVEEFPGTTSQSTLGRLSTDGAVQLFALPVTIPIDVAKDAQGALWISTTSGVLLNVDVRTK